MSKEMNKFISNLIKYDLMGGIVFSLILLIVTDKKIAVIYLFGLSISTINFTINAIIVERCLTKSKNKFTIQISYLLRIAVIILLAMPFIYKIETLLAYLIGFISHYVILIFYWIAKGERM